MEVGNQRRKRVLEANGRGEAHGSGIFGMQNKAFDLSSGNPASRETDEGVEEIPHPLVFREGHVLGEGHQLNLCVPISHDSFRRNENGRIREPPVFLVHYHRSADKEGNIGILSKKSRKW